MSFADPEHRSSLPLSGQVAHRRVVIGDFSSGKSTAINLMLRTLASPVSIGAQSRPVTCLRNVGDLALDLEHDMAGVETRRLDVDRLHGLELFELSSNALHNDSALAERLLERTDSLIWCTIASQAWRNSERLAFQAVRRLYQGPAALIVTRADQLRGPGDRAKIAERLADEALPWFDHAVFIGLSAHRAALLGDDAVWQETGGADLQAALDAMTPAAPTSAVSSVPPEKGSGLFYAAKLQDAKKLNNRSSAPGSNCLPILPNHEEPEMNTNIDDLNQIAGFIGACLVDSDTGLMLASIGGNNFDLEAAGAANTGVVKAKLSAIRTLELDDQIEDILITLVKQFHLIRPLAETPTVFLYLALDKSTANLGMARIQLKKLESKLEI